MPRKNKSIPVNTMVDEFGAGIAIERMAFDDLHVLDNATFSNFEEANQSHRHDRHSFFLLESGTIHLEIDFQQHEIKAPSVIHIHPDQVHQTTILGHVVVSSWAMDNENLHPNYFTLLEDITPAKPLALDEETFSIITEAVSLCIKFALRKNDRLYHALLKDGCNALVALVLSQYLKHATPADKLSRFETVTKAFKRLLERNYTTAKRPAEYAQQINISTAYLNECVKNITGYPVSYHIQQRVMLEAKRLLYNTNKSVKEIATTLGYDDYPYFSRLFTKTTGMTALAFRNNNLPRL